MRSRPIEVPNIWPDTLLFMLDDTGHETLAGNHPVYGLGGICLRASRNESQLRPAWRNLRALVNDDPDIPLHAFEFGQQARARPQLYKPLGDFFREDLFVRLAVTATVKTSVPDHLVVMQPVILTLKKYMADIASLSACGSVAVVFESSERADDALIRHFGNLVVVRNGANIPVEHCLMDKKHHEPALEVADFVANAFRKHGPLETGEEAGISKGLRVDLPIRARPPIHGYRLCFRRKEERTHVLARITLAASARP